MAKKTRKTKRMHFQAHKYIPMLALVGILVFFAYSDTASAVTSYNGQWQCGDPSCSLCMNSCNQYWAGCWVGCCGGTKSGYVNCNGNAVCPSCDPCAGVTCNSPPGSFCSGNNRYYYSSSGTCSSGSCSYSQYSQYCTFGCSGGQCLSCTSSYSCGTCSASGTQTCTDTKCGTGSYTQSCTPSCPSEYVYTETNPGSIAGYCGISCSFGYNSLTCHGYNGGGYPVWGPFGSSCTSPYCTGCGCRPDPCAGVTCSSSTATCPDGYVASCSNSCSNGACSACSPSCAGHTCVPSYTSCSTCSSGGAQTCTDVACGKGSIQKSCTPSCPSALGTCGSGVACGPYNCGGSSWYCINYGGWQWATSQPSCSSGNNCATGFCDGTVTCYAALGRFEYSSEAPAEICGNNIDDNCNGQIDEGCCTNTCTSSQASSGVYQCSGNNKQQCKQVGSCYQWQTTTSCPSFPAGPYCYSSTSKSWGVDCLSSDSGCQSLTYTGTCSAATNDCSYTSTSCSAGCSNGQCIAAAVCGNNKCESTETPNGCQLDCAKATGISAPDSAAQGSIITLSCPLNLQTMVGNCVFSYGAACSYTGSSGGTANFACQMPSTGTSVILGCYSGGSCASAGPFEKTVALTGNTCSQTPCNSATSCDATCTLDGPTKTCYNALNSGWGWYENLPNTQSDTNNCGTICNVCPSGQTCSDGVCSVELFSFLENRFALGIISEEDKPATDIAPASTTITWGVNYFSNFVRDFSTTFGESSINKDRSGVEIVPINPCAKTARIVQAGIDDEGEVHVGFNGPTGDSYVIHKDAYDGGCGCNEHKSWAPNCAGLYQGHGTFDPRVYNTARWSIKNDCKYSGSTLRLNKILDVGFEITYTDQPGYRWNAEANECEELPICVPEYKPDLKCNCNPSCPDSCGGYGLCSGGCPGATPPCACGGTNADGTAQNCCSGNVCNSDSSLWCTGGKCCSRGFIWDGKICRQPTICNPIWNPPTSYGICSRSEACCPNTIQTSENTFVEGCKSNSIVPY